MPPSLTHSRHLCRDSQNRPTQPSSLFARLAIFSHSVPINQLTQLSRLRSLAICFLFLASCWTSFRSGVGKASDMHLANRVMVNQRRATGRTAMRIAIQVVRNAREREVFSSVCLFSIQRTIALNRFNVRGCVATIDSKYASLFQFRVHRFRKALRALHREVQRARVLT